MNRKNAPKAKTSNVSAFGRDLSKDERMNLNKQLRNEKVTSVLTKKTLGLKQPPKTVGLLSFNDSVDSTLIKKIVLEQLLEESEKANVTVHGPSTILLPNWAQSSNNKEYKKQRITFIDIPRNFNAAMDIVKALDVLVFCFGSASLENPAFDEPGYRLLSALKLQGLPSVMGVSAPCSSFGITNQRQVRENNDFCQRFFISELGVDKKFFSLETPMDSKNFIRALSGLTPKMVGFRLNRGYMMGQDYTYDNSTQQLKVRGFARGSGFSCKHLVHITGLGDGILSKITLAEDPNPVIRIHKSADAAMEGNDERFAAVELDVLREDALEALTESWKDLLPFNPLEGEQTHLATKIGGGNSDEEILDDSILIEDAVQAGKSLMNKQQNPASPLKKNKAMMSEQFVEDATMDEEEMNEDGDDDDDDELLKGLMGEGGVVQEEFLDANEALLEKRRMRDQMIERADDEMQFPDEKDTPLDQPAKERFRKYQGLASFKTAPWDPYLNLPPTYSRIFEFEGFRATSKASIKEFLQDCEAVDASGHYVELTIEKITPEQMSRLTGPLIVSTILNIERKVSVQQFRFSRILPYEQPIKSKELVTIAAGFRRFPSRPIYSTIPNKTIGSFECKSRFKKFLHLDGEEYFAHTFSPSVVAPCSALLFKEEEGVDVPHLVAWGSAETPDPTSVCLKRILLTGYPFRVHKTKVVVRFMFFNAADVKYFRPVQLQTKRGVHGHIIESVGTHGYFKARFAGRITHADTVCLPLYKRVYPVWYPPTWGVNESPVEETREAGELRGNIRVQPALNLGDSW
eukprot:GDKJ01014666.1.p1 GENE.GDKJ01014666.1~~GDKJ01014666.1.p1  ORF type:complete len:824 (+),score=256.27 GDKJ01014666.1:69-2474(+)